MGAIYAQHGDAIEFVLANNDNMALGAVEALKANGYFGDTGKFMPVVGVDATDAGARVDARGRAATAPSSTTP